MTCHVFILSISSEARYARQYNPRVYALQDIGSKPELLEDARPEGINDNIGMRDKFLDKSFPMGGFQIYGDRGLMASQKVRRGLEQFRECGMCFVGNGAVNAQNRSTAVGEEKTCKRPCTTSIQSWHAQLRTNKPGASPANSTTRMPVSGGGLVVMMAKRGAQCECIRDKCHT